jgi:hypothetical protein
MHLLEYEIYIPDSPESRGSTFGALPHHAHPLANMCELYGIDSILSIGAIVPALGMAADTFRLTHGMTAEKTLDGVDSAPVTETEVTVYA